MKKLVSIILAIVTLGSSYAYASLTDGQCNPENSSNPDCVISTYQAIYCPDPCAPLEDVVLACGVATVAACARGPSPVCEAAGAAEAAAIIALGLCEAANAVSYSVALALCELGW
jgi:hypothetical protein